jgi:hypothetical protein
MKIVQKIHAVVDGTKDAWMDRRRIRDDLGEISAEVPQRWRSSNGGSKATIVAIAVLCLGIVLMTVT